MLSILPQQQGPCGRGWHKEGSLVTSRAGGEVVESKEGHGGLIEVSKRGSRNTFPGHRNHTGKFALNYLLSGTEPGSEEQR